MNTQVNDRGNDYISDKEFMQMSTKQKIEYFWNNKRKQMIWFAVELVVILAVLVLLTDNKYTAMTGIIMNTSNSVSKEMLDEVKDDAFQATRLDSEKADIKLIRGLDYYPNDKTKAEANYEFMHTLVSQTEKGGLDFLTGDMETVITLAYSSFFQDLSQVLSEDQITAYKPYLRYIDLAVVEKIKQAAGANADIDIEIPDCTKPERMEKPIPVMIAMSKYESLAALYPDEPGSVVFAVFKNSPTNSILCRWIDYLMKEIIVGIP